MTDARGDSRVIAVDLGSVRIGVAGADASGVLASPVTVLERSGDARADHRAILDVARDRGAHVIVVGLPTTLAGTLGPAAQTVAAEVAALSELANQHDIEVETWDERFSTVIAEQRRRAARAGAPRSRRRAPSRRDDPVDAAAASVILQSWLDAHR